MARIAITDDSSFTKDLMTELLQPEGHELLYASSGEELLDKYIEWKVDIVILDIVMPGIDGQSTLKKLMKIDRHAKVIICSAIGGQTKIFKQVMEMGAAAVVSKPISKVELLEAINKCIE